MGSDLQTLADRLEGLSGADRYIDAEIAVAFSGDPGAWVVNPSPHSIFSPAPGWYRTSDDASHNAPEATASLDAVVALVERALKPLSLQVTILSNGSASAVLGTSASPFQFVALAPTAPLALLRSLVAAKMAEGV